jgi:hypothetical protein
VLDGLSGVDPGVGIHVQHFLQNIYFYIVHHCRIPTLERFWLVEDGVWKLKPLVP